MNKGGYVAPKLSDDTTMSPLTRKISTTSDSGHISMNEHEDEGQISHNFVASKGLTTGEAEKRLIEYGRNELPDKKTPKVTNNFYQINNYYKLVD